LKIDSLKDLAKLIKLCRQTGVEAIEVDGVKMNLGPTPTIIKYNKPSKSSVMSALNTPSETDNKIASDELSPEDLLFYSVTNQTPTAEEVEQ
jgi:hypothetical protein